MTPPVPHYSGVAGIADLYDGFVLDVWGVLHDGVTLFPGVVEALDRLRDAGKRVVMLTNAPRRSAAVAGTMMAMGMPEAHCARLLSSGEAAFADLDERRGSFYDGLGNRFIHIGPDRDRGLFDRLDWEETGSLEGVDLIVNTGPWEDGETVADYESLLADGASSRVPMICANPDLEVVRGGRRIACAGALAQRYEELGGKVRYLGKPAAEIYEYCFRSLGGLDRSRIAAIGDSFRTDLVGARNAGIDPVLAVGGIHAAELAGPDDAPDPERLASLAEEWGVLPTASIPAFRW